MTGLCAQGRARRNCVMPRFRNIGLAGWMGAVALWPLLALAGDADKGALRDIRGQWHHPHERCEEASATITVEGERIRFDWVWESGAKSQVEVERIDSVHENQIVTTAIETSGDEQKDLPGHRFRYTLDGDKLTIESLSGTFDPQIVFRCALAV